jgi:3-oxoacyl-[acyl-carrier protein] reductase
MTQFPSEPGWKPIVPDGSRIFVAGASGGLGQAVIRMLAEGSDCIIGAHYATKVPGVSGENILPIKQKIQSEVDCRNAIDSFVDGVGGIDGLVLLNGALHQSGHWMDVDEDVWNADIAVNLSHPFFLARHAMKHMRKAGTGGRIIFNGTESAHHGGSVHSMPYAMTKLATECMVQGMAREGAADNILVNGVRLGFIKSGFHQRWSGRDDAFMEQRADLVPLKRGGEPWEAAALIVYLLSGYAGFITGQMYALTGGDWL